MASVAPTPTSGGPNLAGNGETPVRRKHEYPPKGYEFPNGTLRVHSNEPFGPRSTGRILQSWSRCVKPKGVPANGCQIGRFGYFVRKEDGVIYRAIWVNAGRGMCDWEGEEGKGGEDGEQGDGKQGDGKCVGGNKNGNDGEVEAV